MQGTNARRSVVDEGWEPLRPERNSTRLLLLGFGAAFVLVPLAVFLLTYLVLAR